MLTCEITYLMSSASDWLTLDNAMNPIRANSSELSTGSLPLYGHIMTRVTHLNNQEFRFLKHDS